jgi:cell division protease FtsH
VVDGEVRKLIDGAHVEATEILRLHRATLDQLAEALIERETLDTPALLEIFGDLPVWASNGAAAEGNGTTTRRRRTTKTAT